MTRIRGKQTYSRGEVWDILEEIRADLVTECEDNEVMKEVINSYFDNFEL